MKRSEELLGLSVISIEDGKELGTVSDLIINPDNGLVQYLVVDNGLRYLGIKVLPFRLIEGVGEDAVTIQNSSCIVDLGDEPEIDGLLEKNVRVKGTKVLTRKGKLIGTVSEILVDEDGEGRIDSCEMTPLDDTGSKEIIPSEKIITFGKDVLIIDQLSEASGSLQHVSGIAAEPEVTPVKNAEETNVETLPAQKVDTMEQSEAGKLFEERQRKYLLGRKVSKRIESETGETIAEEGDVITEELMDKAKTAGKFSELSMNTRT
ncbi:PRC-barrel domain-containing protein [Phosphitispora sp. TUW77]|uniref:PRC-barrel domain-containing protein n=1 Tax=Phosphitispora sp. TUW77 TaxID=3152361 RepID=UPI003AB6FD68